MELIEAIKIILIGIVEGITEWLPISSTGHMILFDAFLPLDMTEAFKNMFLVVIQLGAIMAVVVLFWHKLWPFTTRYKGYIKKDTMSLWYKVVVASLPAVVIGLPFDDVLETYLMNAPTVAVMLIVYGLWFIYIENRKAGKQGFIRTTQMMPYRTALLIGCFQVLAMIPGTSRSGATIIGAMILGCSRTVAAEFSFFLAIPIMFGASLLKLVKYFLDGFTFSGTELASLGLGMVVAFGVSVVAIRFLMDFIKKNDFKVFGYYRIVVGLIIFACMAVGVL
ncbi:undecaprenyl-diphosphate phosphatase [Bengtsoniella intestinalis]|uniref:undecaprenyl-diphosphate phosphatase n=1 Tax=Bengtsoniella intestinalis TaxID=3073143 RepID=UPI00391EE66E